MAQAPALPRGKAAWATYAIVATIFALSSAAPFVQLGSGAVRVSGDDIGAALLYLGTWIPLLALAAFLLRRVEGGRAWATHVALLLVLPVVHALAFLVASDAIAGRPVSIAGTLASAPLKVLTLLGTLQYLVLAAVAIGTVAGRAADTARARAAELEASRAQLESLLAKARVDSLTAQLQPHFLFNTLNAIGVLAASDPDGAQLMVRRLSALLRSVLATSDRPMVPLGSEMELLHAYVGIQQARFGERLQVTIDVLPAAAGSAVPPLILQPLVENAIEHAIALNDGPGTIRIAATLDGDRLVLTVEDSGPGEAESSHVSEGTGIGHANTRARLAQLFGDSQRFSVTKTASGGCLARVELPAQHAGTAS
jgi:two-component system LytT family sensor kinase